MSSPVHIKHVDINNNTACVMCGVELPRRPAVYCSLECQRADTSASVAQRHGFYEYMGMWGPPWDLTRRPNNLQKLVQPTTEVKVSAGRRDRDRKQTDRRQAAPVSQKPALELREYDAKVKRYKIVEYLEPRVRATNPLNISSSVTPIPTEEMQVVDSMKSVDSDKIEWYAYDKKKWYAVCIVDTADNKILGIRGINVRMNVSLATAWDQTERSEGNPSTLPDDNGLYWFGGIRPRESGNIQILFSAEDLDTEAHKISIEPMTRSLVVAGRKKPPAKIKSVTRKSKPMKQLKLYDSSTSRTLVSSSENFKNDNNEKATGATTGEDSEGWVIPTAHNHEASKSNKRKWL